jgi:hypothetical protein
MELFRKALGDEKAINKISRAVILNLEQNIAMRHGRRHTGRKPGRPKKLGDADGKRLVTKPSAGSEEEEEEEGE